MLLFTTYTTYLVGHFRDEDVSRKPGTCRPKGLMWAGGTGLQRAQGPAGPAPRFRSHAQRPLVMSVRFGFSPVKIFKSEEFTLQILLLLLLCIKHNTYLPAFLINPLDFSQLRMPT